MHINIGRYSDQTRLGRAVASSHLVVCCRLVQHVDGLSVSGHRPVAFPHVARGRVRRLGTLDSAQCVVEQPKHLGDLCCATQPAQPSDIWVPPGVVWVV